VRVGFSLETGVMENGIYIFSYEHSEAKKCEKEDYLISEEEEAAMGLINDAYCKPNTYNYKLSGQWSSSSYHSTMIKLEPCSNFDENPETCQTDSETLKRALRGTNLNFFYKQQYFDKNEF